MKRKKILILYTTAGLGHKKAASGIRDAICERYGEDIDIEYVDALEYSGRLYRYLYKDGYVLLVSRMKWLWALLFHLTNSRFVDLLTKPLRHRFDRCSLRRLLRAVSESRPDAVVSTHFVTASLARAIKRASGGRVRLYSLVTDYGTHAFWLSHDIDNYFVGAEETKVGMLKRGIRASRITVTGIATESAFLRERDVASLRAEFSLDGDRKTVLVMLGGFGVGPMVEVLRALSDCRDELQLIAVCGHNRQLYDELDRLKGECFPGLKLVGFTDRVADLMALSDLMVTKAGGISVTEALNVRLPQIFFASIPGQEAWNEQLFVRRGAAFKARTYREITELTDRVLLSQDVHEVLAEAINELSAPSAAGDIADAVVSEINDPR